MVKIAIVGGAGNVAQEVVDVLVATKKHDITIFTRRNVPPANPDSAITWIKSDYSDVNALAKSLNGIHTVLSFISPHLDQEEAATVQKTLIDASIQAGVTRFAPSEWGSAGFDHLDWYAYKATTRTYLAAINASAKVIQYSLFTPGLFTNYFAAPHKTATHLTMLETPWDFANRRMLVRDGGLDEDRITLTTVRDFANVVKRAVEYEGVWPVQGGMVGETVSVARLVELGEELRGGSFTLDKLKTEDMENGTWESSWLPHADHPSIKPEHAEAASRAMVPALLLAIRDGMFVSGDEWNRLLPDYEFTSAEDFLREAWKGKA